MTAQPSNAPGRVYTWLVSPWHLLALTTAAFVAILTIFRLWPALDIAISNYFFQPETCPSGSETPVCGRFPVATDAFWMPLRSILYPLPVVIGGIVAAGIGWAVASGRRAHRRVRSATIAVATLLLGPGLIVNLFLKEFWGRPRPVDTDIFGGASPFVPAGQWSDLCASNCSFISGEASATFWLVCLVPLFPRRHRVAAFIGLLALALLASGMRVAFGGHYASDVLLGGLSTIIVYAALMVAMAWRMPPKEAAAQPR